MFYDVNDIISKLDQEYDIVRVIRCRNCANYFPRGEFDGVEYGECYFDDIVNADDFCSRAELRGDSDGEKC